MPVNGTFSQTKPFLVIYQSRIKAVRSAALSLVFLFVSVWMFLTPVNEDDLLGRTAHFLGAYGGPTVFTIILIWSIVQLFAKSRY